MTSNTGTSSTGTSNTGPKRLLFVCVENSNRSQMAEAFARMHGASKVVAYSAGSKPSGRINPRAIASMKELGYDLTRHEPKGLEALPAGDFDAVISMGCGEACPHLPAAIHEDWQIPDPKQMEAADFALVRDQIRAKVEELLLRVGLSSPRTPKK